MNPIQRFALLFSLVGASLGHAATLRICFFSLNNPKESSTLQKFASQLNEPGSKDTIEVKEYISEGSDSPNETFQSVVESGARCDGVVFSGHHSGSFSGKRTNESLGLESIERLSCDPKYKDWISGVKAIWLQGCRTLGQDKTERVQSNFASTNTMTADQHTFRVGPIREEDGMSQSYSQLNREFSAVIDKSHALSSRYLGIFPNSAVFGWTGTAPGTKSSSEYSLIFHLSQMIKLRKGSFPNLKQTFPVSIPSSEKAQLREAATSVLGHTKAYCGKDCVDAWKKQGADKEFGMQNKDVEAFLPRPQNVQTVAEREACCDLRGFESDKAEDHQRALKSMDQILKNPDLFGVAYNSLLQAIQRSADSENVSKNSAIKKALEKIKGPEGEKFRAYLSAKVSNSSIGILDRIDAFGFLKRLESGDQLAKELQRYAFSSEFLLRPAQPSEQDVAHFKDEVIRSLVANGVMSGDELLDAFEKHSKQLKLGQVSPIHEHPNFSASKKDKKRYLERVLVSKDPELRAVASQILMNEWEAEYREEVIDELAKSEHVDHLRKVVQDSFAQLKSPELLANKIFKLPRHIADSDFVRQKLIELRKKKDSMALVIAQAHLNDTPPSLPIPGDWDDVGFEMINALGRMSEEAKPLAPGLRTHLEKKLADGVDPTSDELRVLKKIDASQGDEFAWRFMESTSEPYMVANKAIMLKEQNFDEQKIKSASLKAFQNIYGAALKVSDKEDASSKLTGLFSTALLAGDPDQVAWAAKTYESSKSKVNPTDRLYILPYLSPRSKLPPDEERVLTSLLVSKKDLDQSQRALAYELLLSRGNEPVSSNLAKLDPRAFREAKAAVGDRPSIEQVLVSFVGREEGRAIPAMTGEAALAQLQAIASSHADPEVRAKAKELFETPSSYRVTDDFHGTIDPTHD